MIKTIGKLMVVIAWPWLSDWLQERREVRPAWPRTSGEARAAVVEAERRAAVVADRALDELEAGATDREVREAVREVEAEESRPDVGVDHVTVVPEGGA